MPRYVDVDALWKNVTSNIDDCADFLEIIERQPTVTINDTADKIKVTKCNHNADVGKKVASSCGNENGKDVRRAEPLTDKEQRIFLAAMGREERICEQVDEINATCGEQYRDSLVWTCHEITRKVKGALWTTA